MSNEEHEIIQEGPKYPSRVWLAGMIWLFFSLSFLPALFTCNLSLAALGVPKVLSVSIWVTLIFLPLFFVYAGAETIDGKIPSVHGISIASIVLSVPFHTFSLYTATTKHVDFSVQVLGVFGGGLFLAGLLALSGAATYSRWRMSQEP